MVKLYSAQCVGINGNIITIETDISSGFLHFFSIVGLADKAVEESKERVSAAIKNSGFVSPQKKNQRVVVSLAPADLKKEGPVFDLGIALSYLLATDQIDFDAREKIFLGELALDGVVRPVKGVLVLTDTAKKLGFKEIYLPKENVLEASFIDGIKIFAVSSLKTLISHLTGEIKIQKEPLVSLNDFPVAREVREIIDFKDIRGQDNAKRALEIAASGGHNIAMAGPPGTGKTILAKATPGILPRPEFKELIEIISIASIAGIFKKNIFFERPFRNPHHTASYTAIVGGGVFPKPGEISLAHRGVLFLDEFPEFERRVIEAMRQPLEDGKITVSRIKDTIEFPARIMLIAAMNPCPCGNLGLKNKLCVCAPAAVIRYQRKISGPIADRIDIWTEVLQVDYEILSGMPSGRASCEIKKSVEHARNLQKERFKERGILTNSEMTVKDMDLFISLSSQAKNLLNQAAGHLDLSPRSYHRTIKVAKTLADLESENEIKEHHISESLQYRQKYFAGKF